MKTRLIVVAAFICTVCHFTEAQLLPVKPLNTTITNTTCGTTKLCVSSVPNCDPAGNSSCFFTSAQFNNGTLTIEMSGTTSGYVALGLTPTASPLTQIGNVVFVCGNNKSNAFFETVSQNGSTLTPAAVPAIISPNVLGSTNNQTLTQCAISVNISAIPFIPANVPLLFNLTILNGTTNGTDLGPAATVFNSSGTLDLANPMSNIPQNTLNITRNGCGSTKLCVSSESGCNLTGNSSCFFSSIQVKNQTFSIELSGTTTGYVALGLAKQNTTFVFICGNNNNSFFFQTATQNNTNLTTANVTTVYNSQGVVAQNQTLIQCIFNTSTSFNISTKADDTMYNVTIMNGTTNGTDLGPAATVFNSSGTLDLANPMSNVPQNTVLLNITRNGCGSTKLCVSNESSCNLTGNSSCFFSSFQVKNQTFSIELSGTTTGYVALGLTKQNTTFVFICGNNSNSFFFQTATQNNTNLTTANVTTVYNSQGVVAQNQTLIQCIFNTSTSFNISTKADDTMYNVTIMNGTTNGTQLGPLSVRFNSGKEVDLSVTSTPSSNSSNAITNLCTNVLAVLLSALILYL
ncbi:hypothetical protein KOW79_006060 [Hemibagrus wyckioides]|uniref:Ferric-chelate reductase 1 n=1 Tax=Hemibagrus wyckioides TaxID=337641 RepID=A0A9D3SSG3_9TELE|nr:probable serine/threonine-protein kinase DDB_G0276461 [Hemibagrus wyckioides]KAG7329838.1 hypothetical protein KOW79_006060 [Hemibagrus wyckioides]